MRTPWLFVGLVLGIIGAGLLLPLCSDSTFTIQNVVIVGGMFGGLTLGFLLDEFNRPRNAS